MLGGVEYLVVLCYCLLINVFLQNIQMLFFFFFWNIINYIGGWCIWMCREDKVVVYVEIDVGNQFYCFFEVFGGFVREVNDEIRIDLNIWMCCMQFMDDCFVFQCCMGMVYQVQNVIGIVLYWQMQEVYQFWCVVIYFDDIVGEFDWMVGGKVNMIDFVDCSNQMQQIGK